MPSRICSLLCVVLVTVLVVRLDSLGAPPPTPPPQTAATLREQSQERAARSDQEEFNAMKADIEHMRTILYQMQTNLGFVGNTTTPLYHEFELDIDMWRIEIAQLERRLARLERGKGEKRSP